MRWKEKVESRSLPRLNRPTPHPHPHPHPPIPPLQPLPDPSPTPPRPLPDPSPTPAPSPIGSGGTNAALAASGAGTLVALPALSSKLLPAVCQVEWTCPVGHVCDVSAGTKVGNVQCDAGVAAFAVVSWGKRDGEGGGWKRKGVEGGGGRQHSMYVLCHLSNCTSRSLHTLPLSRARVLSLVCCFRRAVVPAGSSSAVPVHHATLGSTVDCPRASPAHPRHPTPKLGLRRPGNAHRVKTGAATERLDAWLQRRVGTHAAPRDMPAWRHLKSW